MLKCKRRVHISTISVPWLQHADMLSPLLPRAQDPARLLWHAARRAVPGRHLHELY
jgi:hypothetical protein